MCPCGSCTQTSELKLKFVAHVGEVATQTIKRQRKLVGIDVIYVHRLLKNAVQVPEYVLVSEELYRGGGTAPSEPAMQELTQELEGIGPVRTYFIDVGGHRRAARSAAGSVVAPAHRRHARHGRDGACRTSSAGGRLRRRPADLLGGGVALGVQGDDLAARRRAHGVAGHGGQEGRALEDGDVQGLVPGREDGGRSRPASRRAISPNPSPRPSVLTTRPLRTTSARPDSTT